MTVYKELTDLHQRICHEFCNTSKELGVNSPECGEIMKDLESLENLVEKYLGAKMNNYQYVKE